MVSSHFQMSLPTRKGDNTTSQLRITALERRADILSNVNSAWKLSLHQHIIPLNLQRFLSIREYMQNFKNKTKEQSRPGYLLATSLGFSPALLVILLSAPILIIHCKHSMWPCPAAVKNNNNNQKIHKKVIVITNNFLKFWTVPLESNFISIDRSRQLTQESHKSLPGQGGGARGRKSEGIEVRTEIKCHGCFLVSKVKGEKQEERIIKPCAFYPVHSTSSLYSFLIKLGRQNNDWILKQIIYTDILSKHTLCFFFSFYKHWFSFFCKTFRSEILGCCFESVLF